LISPSTRNRRPTNTLPPSTTLTPPPAPTARRLCSKSTNTLPT
tara:strand:- start:149606 stop:149734 length:129 start_codon:yes stop_codon:yes gene_type:complete